jgi:hypothetical protein
MSKDTLATLKLFAISNQMVESGLDRVEESLSLDLGREKAGRVDKDRVYYPQFDSAIRAEAAHMAQHYEIFFCLEKSIRKLIVETLESAEPTTWWNNKRIPPNIYGEVGKRIQREMDSGITVRSEDPIDYTTFGELSEIIKQNWDVFGSMFDSLRAVEKVMSSLNLLRGPIAHCTLLSEDEVVRLRLSVKDWFRLME